MEHLYCFCAVSQAHRESEAIKAAVEREEKVERERKKEGWRREGSSRSRSRSRDRSVVACDLSSLSLSSVSSLPPR